MEFLFKILNDNEVLLELYKECIMKRSYYLQDMYCLLYLYQNNEYKNEIKQSIMYRIKKELTKVYLNDNLISQEQIQQIYEQNLNEYISRTGFKINI